MATSSTQVLAWVASLLSGSAIGQSSNLTATVNITSGFEILIPVGVRYPATTVSSDAVVKIYPSNDGGSNFDTLPSQSFSIARTAAALVKTSFKLPAGIYAIQLQSSGPATQTFQILTQQVLSAILNQ